MIKIDQSPAALGDFRSLLSESSAFPEGIETFTISGTRTRISHSAELSLPASPVEIRFRPADPALVLTQREGKFSEAERDNILCLLASPDARFGSLRINAAVRIYTCKLGEGHQIQFHPRPAHHLRIYLNRGQLDVLGKRIASHEIASISDEKKVLLSALSDSEFLMLELG